jgi:hypothetical protein
MAKISDLTAITTIADNHVLVINDGTPTTKKITVANLKTGLGVKYKKLVALINQSGTNAPTLTILENTTGATFTTFRFNTGSYLISASSSVFTSDKTLILANNYRFPFIIDINRNGVDSIIIGTYNSSGVSDNVLLNASFEIRIYE